jgi:hypothetical protein
VLASGVLGVGVALGVAVGEADRGGDGVGDPSPDDAQPARSRIVAARMAVKTRVALAMSTPALAPGACDLREIDLPPVYDRTISNRS